MGSQVLYRCKNCNHIFIVRKRIRKHRCSNCGIRNQFNKWTAGDLKVILDLFEKEPYDLETLKAAQMIVEAEKRGEVVKIGKKYMRIKQKKKPPTRPIIPEQKPPEPEYQYCMWIHRGCINPDKKIGKDRSSCIKNKLEDNCLLLPDEDSQ